MAQNGEIDGKHNPVKVRVKVEIDGTADFYCIVYHLIQEGRNPSQIASFLGIPKQNLNFYVSRLKNLDLISNLGNGVWAVKGNFEDIAVKVKNCLGKSKFSTGMTAEKPLTNLHALEIKFPILSGKINDSDWEIKNQLNHWLPKYKGLTNLGGLTIRNNNNKSITVFAKSRNILTLEEVDNLAFKIRAFIGDYFKSKKEVTLDIFDCETKNLNLATEDSKAESMIRKGEKFELDLKKRAEPIFKNDNIKGKAWIDGSPFKFSAETNDKEWKRWYLTMPFSIRDIHQALFLIEEYNINLKLHLEVQREQLKTQKENQKMLKLLGSAIKRLKK